MSKPSISACSIVVDYSLASADKSRLDDIVLIDLGDFPSFELGHALLDLQLVSREPNCLLPLGNFTLCRLLRRRFDSLVVFGLVAAIPESAYGDPADHELGAVVVDGHASCRPYDRVRKGAGGRDDHLSIAVSGPPVGVVDAVSRERTWMRIKFDLQT